jgi:hypothetical protein
MGLTSALPFVPRSQLYDRIVSIDFETYYDKQYSLRAKDFSTTDYIRHPNFKTHCVGIQFDDWEEPLVLAGDDIVDFFATVDWSRTAVAAQHTHFDGLILTHHYGVYPAFWLDTLSMSRTVFGTDVRHDHGSICERLGRTGKARAKSLKVVEGIRDLPDDLLDDLADYCGDDTSQCLANCLDLMKVVQEDELRIIDATIRMYVEPVLRINTERVEKLLEYEIETKQAAFANAGVPLDELKSANKFAEQLRGLGVEPPTKISPRTGKEAYAFAKNDLSFKALEHHPDVRVRSLVKARLRSKSEQIEARSKRIIGYGGLPLPIYLAYWAAHTGRWGGGDKVNWQNLPRRGEGAELRRAIEAPDNHLLVFSDASQIEARLNAWDSGQWDKVDAFAAGVDVYRRSAALGYGKPEEEVTEDERFVFKTFELGGGYGAGVAKINFMFKIGQFGPPLDQTFEETKDLLYVWRQTNAAIVQNWKRIEQVVTQAFLGGTSIECGPVVYEGYKGDGFMHLPGGTYVRYPGVWYDNDNRQLYTRRGDTDIKLWGGILVENRIQALARKLLVWQILRIEEHAAGAGIWNRWVLTVHDEIMYVVREADAERFAAVVKEVMSSIPPWAAGLPVNAKTEISTHYSKS